MIVACMWVGNEYHVEPKGFKFKNTRSAPSNHYVAAIGKTEIVLLIVEKIIDLYIGKRNKFLSVLWIFCS